MKTPTLPVEQFSLLEQFPWLYHGFTGRVPGIDVQTDRATALSRLDHFHREALERVLPHRPLMVKAEQVHGAQVTHVDAGTVGPVPASDGLITDDPRVCLGIYVADCCAVFLVDQRTRAIGLLHSGKKGTEAAITRVAIDAMRLEFGTRPEDLLVQLSPCIRPPHYEINFAADIVKQARDCGVASVQDCGTCTATHVDRYYSYRREKGQTGRMLGYLNAVR